MDLLGTFVHGFCVTYGNSKFYLMFVFKILAVLSLSNRFLTVWRVSPCMANHSVWNIEHLWSIETWWPCSHVFIQASSPSGWRDRRRNLEAEHQSKSPRQRLLVPVSAAGPSLVVRHSHVPVRWVTAAPTYMYETTCLDRSCVFEIPRIYIECLAQVMF